MKSETESKNKHVQLSGKQILGNWVNQHGSVLNIYLTDGDKITGSFKSGVGAHEKDEEFIAAGLISDKLVSFSVNFETHGCITSWIGHYTNCDGEESLETMWHLARMIPEGSVKNALWSGVWTGADRFVRMKEKESRDLTKYEKPRGVPSHPFQLCSSL